MKKMYILMMAFVAAFSSMQAHDASKEAVANEEQAFVEKLSETHKALFSAMTNEQKAAAMTASAQPDAAVEKVIQELSVDSQK